MPADDLAPDVAPSPLAPSAAAHARAAAERAGVDVREIADVTLLRDASRLFGDVWGRSEEGVPIHSEVMLEITHAGGCITGAFDGDDLVGAAVLAAARPAGSTYGFLAAAAPGRAGAGVGRALKLRQRAWALGEGLTSMRWTFDPLVARNARFNLARLGACAPTYEKAFFGRMADAVNGDDEADRLVAQWVLDDPAVEALAAGGPGRDASPAAEAETLHDGPDGEPLAVRDTTGLWCRVPPDIVALRRDDPALASAWRTAVRGMLAPALAGGASATHLTRDGWYLLEGTS